VSRAERLGAVAIAGACVACCAPLIVGAAVVAPPLLLVGAGVAAVGGGAAALRRRPGKAEQPAHSRAERIVDGPGRLEDEQSDLA